MSIFETPIGDTERRLRSRELVTHVSYLRALRTAAQGTTRTQLGSRTGISQPSVSSA